METALRMPGSAHAFAIVVLSTMALAACGEATPDASSGDAPAAGASGTSAALTPEQLENGIGPIESMELGAIDTELAAVGEETFIIKCSACHKMDERYVGPALRDVTQRRSPAFIMNMILNPEGMLAEHPEARAMLAQFAVPMANQNLTEDQARAVLEYLRVEAEADPGS